MFVQMRSLKLAILLSALLMSSMLISCGGDSSQQRTDAAKAAASSADADGKKGSDMADKVVKSDEEWRKELTPEQYYVTREKGTERAFTGAYYNLKDKGVYKCVACGNELFRSDEKFDSGTGWPSFWAPVSEEKVKEESDYAFGMKRVEVMCNKCESHLGHVFDDGPAPTNLRYCINSAALKFEKKQ